ncbi:MAG: hypothetical protein PHX18_04725 [Candidatus Gastranaerophilales bacterium]|nr:hypothetical protein [Candidatus Gastranaerophilales bacterium]
MRIKNIRFFESHFGIAFKNDVFVAFKTPTILAQNSLPFDNVSISHPKQISSVQPQNNMLKTTSIIAGSVLAGIGGIFLIKKLASRGVNKSTEDVYQTLKTQYQNILQQFPQDKFYYEQLAKSVGLQAGEEFKLASIVGTTQLKKFLNTFTPQDFQVGKNIEAIDNFTYRVNLHNHTTTSDGKLSVEQFLEHARRWSDKVAQKIGDDGKPPFTIAITDHDTVDGAKRAVEIIAKNPDAYKNLRLVLGGEFSLVHTDANDVNTPLNYEILGYCLNPFDKVLDGFLQKLRNSRIIVMKKILENANKLYPEYRFDWKEAQLCGNNLGKALSNGYIYNLRDYMALKAGIYEFAKQKNNDFITNLLHTVGADFIEKSAFQRVDNAYISRYLENSKLSANFDTVASKIKPEFLEYIDKTRDNYTKSLQALIDTNASITSNKFFNEATGTDFNGFFGLAHPGLVALAEGKDYGHALQVYCKDKNIDWKEHLFEKFLNKLISDSNDRLNAVEINYQSYGQRYNGFEDYIKYITTTVNKAKQKLFNTGGVDCHGETIFSAK